MLCRWSGPTEFNCWIVFLLRYAGVCTVESLSLFYLLFCISICMYYEMIHRQVRDLSREPNMYLSESTPEIRVRLVPSNMIKPSSIFPTDHSKAVPLLWILFVIYVSCFSLSHVCSLQPCGDLLGKGWPLCSLLFDVSLGFGHCSILCNLMDS